MAGQHREAAVGRRREEKREPLGMTNIVATIIFCVEEQRSRNTMEDADNKSKGASQRAI